MNRDKLNSIIDDLNKTDDHDMNVTKRRYRLLKDLPTFKAGDEFELAPCGALVQITNGRTGVCAYTASTLEKFPNILTDWFEEIKSAEPLIKDEKIRKAVRAWAEANELKPDYEVKYDADRYGLISWQADISFNFRIEGLEHNKKYIITELCGEEEE